MITQERLKEVLHYDRETGVFTWKVATNRRIRVGQAAGYVGGKGYVQISIDGKLYRAQRLAWLYMTGEWPQDQIDHKDGDKANNRLDNLREATRGENQRNRGAQCNSTSGYKGVYWHKQTGRWQAQVQANGQRRSAYFNSKEIAALWAASTRARLHGEFANHG